MSLFDLVAIVVVLWMIYTVLRAILGTVWYILVSLWALVGWTEGARLQRQVKTATREMDRIAKGTKRQHQAIGEIYTRLMEASDRAARDIINRR
jgi:hypothetical protein